MQPNEITFNVDVLNDGNTTPQVYKRFDQVGNRSVYHGASHAADLRDAINLYRSPATKNGNFRGVQKTAIKVTRDKLVPGVDSTTTLTSPMIGDISFSLPLGVTAADVLELRQLIIAALDVDAIMDALNLQLEI